MIVFPPIAGPAGPAGPAGADGATGATGPAGPTGASPITAVIDTDEAFGTSSNVYGDLPTVGPFIDVVLASPGNVTVAFSAILYNATGSGFTGYVSVAASNATTLAASDTLAVFCASPGGSFVVPVAGQVKLALNAGTTRLTLKYKRDNSGQAWHALRRVITAFVAG